MAWSHFKYSCVDGQQGDLRHSPYLSVTIVGKNGQNINVFALIDSGSEMTMISKDLAPILGINFSHCTLVYVGGVGNVKKTGYQTNLSFGFEDFPKVVCTGPIIFCDTTTPMLLGQSDFFKRFKVLFEGNEGKFSLNPITKLK